MIDREKALMQLAQSMGDFYYTQKRAKFTAFLLQKMTDDDFINSCLEVGCEFKWMPPPVEFLKRSRLNESKEDRARGLVGKIFSAIREIGPYRVEDAKKELGVVGWKIVRAYGGWDSVCEITHDQKPALTAQWIKLAMTYIEEKKRDDRLAITNETKGNREKLLKLS